MSVPDISILTATLPHPDRIDLISETYDSLLKQDLQWEWLIQVDQSPDLWPEGSPCPELPKDRRIQIEENVRQIGLARSRNAALERSSGQAVMTLDDDDLLVPGSLEKLLELLRDEEVGYVSAGIQDFAVEGDGGRTRPAVPEGLNGPNLVPDYWLQPWSRFPLIPAATLFARQTVLGVSGWEHLPQGEDILFMTKVDAELPGFITHLPLYRYRQHKSSFYSQTGAQHWWKSSQEYPDEYRETRELVFRQAWSLLFSGKRILSRFTSPSLQRIRVDLGSSEVVVQECLQNIDPESGGTLACREHFSGDPLWARRIPDTSPERLRQIIASPELVPTCAVCSRPFVEVQS